MLTLVYAYFNNGNMISVHQQYWRKFRHPERCRAIIVDDCSQKQPLSAYRFDARLPVRRFRVKDDIPWNQDGARNLAMTHAEGWCALLDMDHVLPAESEDRIHSMVKDPKVVYKFTRVNPEGKRLRKPGANIFLMHSDLFWETGGYDERFAGYYGSDINFIRRLKLHSEFVFTDIPLITYSQGYVTGASTSEYGRKGTAYDIINSPHYPLLGQANKPASYLNFEWEELL